MGSRGPLLRFPEEGGELCSSGLQASLEMYPSWEQQVFALNVKAQAAKDPQCPSQAAASHSDQQAVLLRQPQGGLQGDIAEVDRLEKVLP